MATALHTTQRVVYMDCAPDEARDRFTGHGGRQPGDPSLAWAHGECLFRAEEIPAMPTARVISGEYAGQSGTLLQLSYDLTHQRYDRWYFAIIEGVTYKLLDGKYHALVPITDCEIQEVAAMRER